MSRRAAIGGLTIGAIGTGIGAGALLDHRLASPTVSPPVVSSAVSVSAWVAQRGSRYYIGHRGSGDVYPEHSLEGYRAVLDAGARCIEVSVGMTSDGTLICMHDPTYDRTTTMQGTISTIPSTVLRSVRLRMPQLGPAWDQEPVPQVPRPSDVLRELGGRVVLCIEAKNDAAYPALIAAIETAGIKDTVMVKASYSSHRIQQARAAGYPVFAYFGNESDVTTERITALAAVLDRTTDCIVLPTSGAAGWVDADFVAHAVATGIPTWVYGTHRRSDAAHFFDLGCQGIVASSLEYVASARAVATADTWLSAAIAQGEMTKDPGSSAYAPTWTNGELHLGVQGAQHFLTLGQCGPLRTAAGTYVVTVQACWPRLPASSADNLTVAFGRSDDSYYEHELGSGDGYHAVVRVDGRLELYRHVDGQRDGRLLGSSVSTPPPTAGQWFDLRLEVTPTSITWSRTDVAARVRAVDSTVRGGYLHIGRSSNDGVAAFRELSIG